MKTEPIFKTLATPDGHQWRMRMRLITTDAARARDTRINAEVGAHNSQMMGRRWAGNFEANFAKLSAADKRTALDTFKRLQDRYGLDTVNSGTTLRPTNSGSLGTGWDETRPEQEFGLVATPESVQRTNDKFWRDLLGQPAAPVKTSHRGPVTPADMNAAAKAFWDNQSKVRAGGEWGKG